VLPTDTSSLGGRKACTDLNPCSIPVQVLLVGQLDAGDSCNLHVLAVSNILSDRGQVVSTTSSVDVLALVPLFVGQEPCHTCRIIPAPHSCCLLRP